MRPGVEVVLSTYNGGRYLPQQLQSLQAQTYTDWYLRSRDDGSSDDTLSILQRAAKDRRIALTAADGERLGACASFARLLASSEADYVLFCDQDDLWLPEKIETLLDLMRAAEQAHGAIPLLVHSDLVVVNSEGNTIHPSFWSYQALDPERIRLHQLLVQNNVTGCTVLVNRALKERAVPIPATAIMHDWWLALVASAFGKIFYSQKPLVRYRQHETNRLGAKKFDLAYVARQILPAESLQTMRESVHKTVVQAQTFLDTYADYLSPELHSTVQEYATLFERGAMSRRRTILTHQFFKHGLTRTLGLLLSV